MQNKYVKPSSLLILLGLLLVGTTVFSQRTLTGKVTASDDGSPLIGASIALKGTSLGTVSDIDGSFTLQIPQNVTEATVVVTYTGYKDQEIAVGSQTYLDIVLQTDVALLQEAVVTGYGTQSRRDITGAVATIATKQLLSVPATNVAQAMQGRVAGVNVSNENAPGGNVMVRIRGFGNINDNTPLFVVDGMPTKGNLNTLNLNDIETIQILKDASAASIYGSRAGNGVVIITTKRGKLGKPKFTYDAYYGQQSPIKFLDLLNTQEYVDLLWESRINAQNPNLLIDGKISDPSKIVYPNIPMFGGQVATPVIPDYIFPVGGKLGQVDESTYSVAPKNLITRANKEGTDWFDEIFDSAPIQNHQIGVSGATEQARYAMSLNYFDQQGIMKYTSYKRYSIRANTEFSVSKRIRIGENLQLAYGEQIGQPNGNQNESNPISFAYRVPPITPLYDVKGYFAGSPTVLDNSRSPLAELYRNKDNLNKELRLFGNAYAEVDILQDLTARSQFGVDYGTFNLRRYRANDPESPEPVGNNVLTTFNNYDVTWTWYNTLTYAKEIGIHRFNVMIGTEAIKNYFEFFTGERNGFAVDDLTNQYLSAGRAGINNSGGASEWTLASEFGRINYALSDKYLIDATIRRDRSSRFAPEFRTAYFPSVSAGWVLSNEPFLSSLSALTFAKVRVGWGQTGNQEIGNYNSFSTFATSPESSFYDLAGANTSSRPGYELAQFGNARAKWETTTSINAGIDVTLWDGRLDLNFDWFDRRTSDMLFPVEVQFTQGVAANPFQNIGEMQNTGVELGLNYRGKIGNDFSYAVGGNFSTYKNTVLKTTGDPNTQYFGFSNLRLPTGTVSVTQQGYPLASFFGYDIIGIFQTDAEGSEYPVQFGGGAMNKAGAFKFRDVNGDKIINSADRTIIGSPHPDFMYGVNITLNYKNFQLDVFGQGVQGNELFNYTRYWTDFPTFGGNRTQRMFEDSWRPGKTDAKLPIPRSNDVISSNPSTYYLEDGSYFRLKNVQLTYALPARLISRFGISDLRLWLQGQNLVTITKYEGLDPEVNLRNYGSGSDRQLGVDEGVYPAFRSINIGVNVGF